ncbi:hypothetical protein LT493_04440 [Streptomyces tricolor]|nr:hypothetical protein [Streptomyces tricolor]
MPALRRARHRAAPGLARRVDEAGGYGRPISAVAGSGCSDDLSYDLVDCVYPHASSAPTRVRPPPSRQPRRSATSSSR